jgi:O-antigen ligase
MVNIISRSIAVIFYLLFFFIPLAVFPKSSELFEFNKVIPTYLFTVLIVGLWLSKMVVKREIIFRRTILDIPLLVFLLSQVLSTLTSIDTRSSMLGYYSRFHGGLASSITYSLLYWAYVANMNRNKTMKAFYIILSSAFLVSLYGILQHFGFDKDIWVQDVQTRIFSSLGQPNWLAAWLVGLIPITWALALKSGIRNQELGIRNKKFLLYTSLSALFFLTLLYTKSRSGLLGFAIAAVVFWPSVFMFIKKRKASSTTTLIKFLILNSLFIILVLIVGSPWTPSISKFVNKSKNLQSSSLQADAQKPQGPALAVGGSESGEIRKIVWTGAIDVWKNYPILGSGLETFAFAYYNFRPLEHNLVSEWDYLYNKAHNEYLNIAATTGSIGLLSYAILVFASIYLFLKEDRKNRLILIALLSGYVSILVTNFFGFSVVPVGLQFFLYPAFAIALRESGTKNNELSKAELTTIHKVSIGIVIILTSYFLVLISRYWYADLVYAKGKLENDSGNFIEGKKLLIKAVNLSESEAIFWDELSQSSIGIALALYEKDDQKRAQEFADFAIAESEKAIQLSPANVNLKRNRAILFIKLSVINPNYLINARDTLLSATAQAPTDAKLFYNLGLVYIRTGEIDKAIETLEETIEMKKNYRNARFALALVLIDEGEKKQAMKELEYILEFIGLDDPLVRQELEELKETI